MIALFGLTTLKAETQYLSESEEAEIIAQFELASKGLCTNDNGGWSNEVKTLRFPDPHSGEDIESNIDCAVIFQNEFIRQQADNELSNRDIFQSMTQCWNQQQRAEMGRVLANFDLIESVADLYDGHMCDSENNSTTDCIGEVTCQLSNFVVDSAIKAVPFMSPDSDSNYFNCNSERGEMGCLTTLFRGIWENIKANVTGIREIARMAWEGLKAAGRSVSSLWSETEELESATSTQLLLAEHQDDSFFAKARRDGWFKTLSNSMNDFFNEIQHFLGGAIGSQFSCPEQLAHPFENIECEEPYLGWDCASCAQRVNMICGVTGFLGGEAVSAFLTGGAIGTIIRGSALAGRAARSTSVAARMSRMGSQAYAMLPNGTRYWRTADGSFQVLKEGARSSIIISKNTMQQAFQRVAQSTPGATLKSAGSLTWSATRATYNNSLGLYIRALDRSFMAGYGVSSQIINHVSPQAVRLQNLQQGILTSSPSPQAQALADDILAHQQLLSETQGIIRSIKAERVTDAAGRQAQRERLLNQKNELRILASDGDELIMRANQLESEGLLSSSAISYRAIEGDVTNTLPTGLAPAQTRAVGAQHDPVALIYTDANGQTLQIFGTVGPQRGNSDIVRVHNGHYPQGLDIPLDRIQNARNFNSATQHRVISQLENGDQIRFIDTQGREITGTYVSRGEKSFRVEVAGEQRSIRMRDIDPYSVTRAEQTSSAMNPELARRLWLGESESITPSTQISFTVGDSRTPITGRYHGYENGSVVLRSANGNLEKIELAAIRSTYIVPESVAVTNAITRQTATEEDSELEESHDIDDPLYLKLKSQLEVIKEIYEEIKDDFDDDKLRDMGADIRFYTRKAENYIEQFERLFGVPEHEDNLLKLRDRIRDLITYDGEKIVKDHAEDDEFIHPEFGRAEDIIRVKFKDGEEDGETLFSFRVGDIIETTDEFLTIRSNGEEVEIPREKINQDRTRNLYNADQNVEISLFAESDSPQTVRLYLSNGENNENDTFVEARYISHSKDHLRLIIPQDHPERARLIEEGYLQEDESAPNSPTSISMREINPFSIVGEGVYPFFPAKEDESDDKTTYDKNFLDSLIQLEDDEKLVIYLNDLTRYEGKILKVTDDGKIEIEAIDIEGETFTKLVDIESIAVIQAPERFRPEDEADPVPNQELEVTDTGTNDDEDDDGSIPEFRIDDDEKTDEDSSDETPYHPGFDHRFREGTPLIPPQPPQIPRRQMRWTRLW